MRFTKGLGYGLAGVLVAGLLLATAISTAEGEVDDSPMTIPVGAVGDEVSYAILIEGVQAVHVAASDSVRADGGLGASPNAQPASTEAETYRTPFFEGFQVVEVDREMDRAGVLHDVVRVAPSSTQFGSGASSVSVDAIDMATRDVIRADRTTTYDSGTETRMSFFGPGIWGETDVSYFAFQGETLRLGMDASHLPLVTDAIVLGAGANGSYEGLDWSAKVVKRAVVDGHDAYAVEVDVRFDGELITGYGWSARNGATSGINVTHAGAATFHLLRTVWITEDVPYPLYIVDNYSWPEQQSRSHTVERFLSQFVPGDEPIPWGDDSGAHYLERNTDAERASTVGLSDGSQPAVPYRLSQATQAVESDVLLLGFQQWRSTHAGYNLIGASHGTVSTALGQQSYRWDLTFGVPSGDAFEVRTTRDMGVDQPRNEELGKRSVPAYDAADLPRNALTISAAANLWQAVAASEYADQGVNAVAWGFNPQREPQPQDPFGALQIGHVRADGDSLTGADLEMSILSLEIDTGLLIGLSEHESDHPGALFRPVESDQFRPDRIQAAFAFDGVQPPEVEEAALVTTSLLAVFLAAYFWPVIKYGAAQAAFLGGYAKIKKDEVLDNEVRSQIHQAIQNDPGVNASEVGRRVAAGWGTVVYHLRVLEKNGYVSSLVDGRHKRFFPVGEVDWSKRGQIAALRNPKARTIFEAIADDPGIIQGDLADVAGISVPAAIWHLKRLEDAGLVGREKQGRKVHYYANEAEEGRGPDAYDPDEAVEVA